MIVAILLLLPWLVLGHVTFDTKLFDVAPTLDNLKAFGTAFSISELRTLSTQVAIPRTIGSEGHTEVRQLIERSCLEAGWSIERDSFQDTTPHGIKTFSNVICSVRGQQASDETIVLSAHYDSKIMEYPFIGATDSAIPVAMLLQMLKHAELWVGDQNVDFVFFDGEEAFVSWTREDSVYGARHLADKWAMEPPFDHYQYRTDPHDFSVNIDNEIFEDVVDDDDDIPFELPDNRLNSISCLILLDLLAVKDVRIKSYWSQTFPLYQGLVKMERHIKKRSKVATRFVFENKTAQNGIGMDDDHRPFLEKGVPVVHVIPYRFPEVWHNVGGLGAFGLRNDLSAQSQETQAVCELEGDTLDVIDWPTSRQIVMSLSLVMARLGHQV